jgi:hypothetical protein
LQGKLFHTLAGLAPSSAFIGVKSNWQSIDIPSLTISGQNTAIRDF